MTYDKHKILIDIDEYNEMKEAADSRFFTELYKKCITSLINTKGDVKAANLMLVGSQYEIRVTDKRINIDPRYAPHIPGEIIPMEAIKIVPINTPK